MNVLFVDGPAQGKVMDIDDGASIWQIPVPRALTLMSIAEEGQCVPNFDTAVYHIQHVPMFGEWITVGTVRAGRPNDYDMFNVLVSGEAKMAMRI